jgi:hypothetical protein
MWCARRAVHDFDGLWLKIVAHLCPLPQSVFAKARPDKRGRGCKSVFSLLSGFSDVRKNRAINKFKATLLSLRDLDKQVVQAIQI